MVEDSYNKFKNCEECELLKQLKIKFLGEKGIDAGGLTREWMCKVSGEVVDPMFGLFIPNYTGDTC